jgi:hypothetical protein
MDVRADPVGCPSWTSYGCLKDILMSSPVDVQLGISMDVQKNGRLWYQLKIWEKLKDLTLSGIEPGTPECYASVMHQCYTCSYQYETKGIFKLRPY